MPKLRRDFESGSEDQARALRNAAQTRTNLPIDWENVAEEIESLGKSQARELASRIRTILVHLMKLATSPAVDPRAGWRATIRCERVEIEALLQDSPSLRPSLADVVQREGVAARRIVEAEVIDFGETPLVDLSGVRYAVEQVVGDWFPE